MIIYHIGDDSFDELIGVLYQNRIKVTGVLERVDTEGRLNNLDPSNNTNRFMPISEGEIMLISPEQGIAIGRSGGPYSDFFSRERETRGMARSLLWEPGDHVLRNLGSLREVLSSDDSRNTNLKAKVEVTINPI